MAVRRGFRRWGFKPGSESVARTQGARAAAKTAGVKAIERGNDVEKAAGHVALGTMNLAKGLEFRAGAVTACDDEIVPLQERIGNVADEADLEDVDNTERQLLYVACARAREHLLVTGVELASEFLEDLADGNPN